MAKRMTSQYENSKCCACLQPIALGEDIEYTKGEGARHIACIGQPAQQVKPERLARAVAFLVDRTKDGNGGRFLTNVYEGYKQRGKLSIGQIEAVLAIADRPPLPGPDVIPAGNYCIPVKQQTGNGNDLMFVKVKRWGTDGVTCYLILGPREDRKLNAEQAMIRIQEFGVADAAKLYGREIGRCCICNTQLTNRLSRQLSIGPVCGGRVHDEDEWYVMRKAAKADLLKQGLDPDDELPPVTADWAKAATDDEVLERPVDKAFSLAFRKPKPKPARGRKAKAARSRQEIAADMSKAIAAGEDFSHLLAEIEALS